MKRLTRFGSGVEGVRGWCVAVVLVFLFSLAFEYSREHALAAEKAALPPATQRRVEFGRDVEPLFKARCHVCHGPQQQMNGLRLDGRQAALKGGYSGRVIVPGNSAESKLIRLVAGLDAKIVMPPVGEKLTAEEVGLLRGWIDQGAEWPEALMTQAEGAGADESGAGSDHWAFQPLEKPRLPRADNNAWVRNGVDAFVLARLESEGIEPSPVAEKTTLARRLSLDLTGLPPSPELVEEFVSDSSSDAYERLADRLLESQHYGEKWAMHWLDLARYADSDGYEKDLTRPHAWRYRHWVINAFNNDLPFDQFTIDQIAGDLVPNATVEQRVAAGLHRNTLKNREGGVNVEQYRFEETIDRANTVGTVWLALSVGCAQCHDHKYDPTTQKDYYRFFAFFNSIDEVNIDAPLAGEFGPYLAARPEHMRKRREILAKHKVAELQPPWEAKLHEAAANPGRWTDWDLTYDVLPLQMDKGHQVFRKSPGQRTDREAYEFTKLFLRNYGRVVPEERYKELGFKEAFDQLNALDDETAALSRARSVEERSEPRTTHIHIRGGWDREGREVSPGTPAFLPPPKTSSGSTPTRLDLANWIVSRDNPLTARVAVNRIWQEYFGRGIVLTSENFGTQGEKPSHPELLDWLVTGFMDQGWSLKKLHKTIVTSATYRQSSNHRPELKQRDPGNVLLARQSRMRLAGELIRDSALSVSGLLYPKIGGKSVRPPQPEGVAALGYSGQVKWEQSEGKDAYRRGLYVHFQRAVPYPFLMNFDSPDMSATECRRERSNTPLQALNLLNDEVFFESARAFGARVLQDSPGDDFPGRLDYAYRLALARPPSATEQERLLGFYLEQKQKLETDPEKRDALFAAALEGVPQVEAAVWVAVSRVVLNLDEFITRE